MQASLGQSGPEPLPGGVEFGEVTQRSWSICSEAADQISGCCSGGATLHSSERLPRGHPNNFHTCTIRHHPAAALLLLKTLWPPSTIRPCRPSRSFGFPRQQLRQLGDPGRDLSRLILGHEICRSASSRLRFEIDIRHGKVVGVADDIGDAPILLNGPGRWEAALAETIIQPCRPRLWPWATR